MVSNPGYRGLTTMLSGLQPGSRTTQLSPRPSAPDHPSIDLRRYAYVFLPFNDMLWLCQRPEPLQVPEQPLGSRLGHRFKGRVLRGVFCFVVSNLGHALHVFMLGLGSIKAAQDGSCLAESCVFATRSVQLSTRRFVARGGGGRPQKQQLLLCVGTLQGLCFAIAERTRTTRHDARMRSPGFLPPFKHFAPAVKGRPWPCVAFSGLLLPCDVPVALRSCGQTIA